MNGVLAQQCLQLQGRSPAAAGAALGGRAVGATAVRLAITAHRRAVGAASAAALLLPARTRRAEGTAALLLATGARRAEGTAALRLVAAHRRAVGAAALPRRPVLRPRRPPRPWPLLPLLAAGCGRGGGAVTHRRPLGRRGAACRALPRAQVRRHKRAAAGGGRRGGRALALRPRLGLQLRLALALPLRNLVQLALPLGGLRGGVGGGGGEA